MWRRILVLARIAASIAAVASVTVLHFRFVSTSPTTVALSYLVLILLIATQWGIVESTVASVLAALSFNMFFLPPVGLLTIADPQNWFSFVAFMVTAIVASQLSSRARERNLEAMARQRDLERLYTLSRALLLSDERLGVPAGIARQIAEAFELPAVALYDRSRDTVSRTGMTELPGIEEGLRAVARHAVPRHEPPEVIILPIRLGGAPIGSLALMGATFSDTVLQSVVNLAGIGLERARAQEVSTRAEAARQSSELRATVLDALAHEFKTPLTSIKAAASTLRSTASSEHADRELMAVISEESNRLQGLVDDAIQMLRIDAGDFALNRARHVLADVVATTIKESGLQFEGHTLNSRVPAGLVIDVDGRLLRLALRQLLDNALKYSPPTSAVEIVAEGNGTVDIAVRNSGPAIPEHEQSRIFERFYRGAQAGHVPGTGMGLAIVQRIAGAHGGTLTVSSTDESGTEFCLSLPRLAAQDGEAAALESGSSRETHQAGDRAS